MKPLHDLLNKMDKTKWLILGLSGILLLVIALPADNLTKEKQDDALGQSLNQEGQTQQVQTYEKQLAEELEQVLRCIDGAGKVRVMITFQDNGESIVEKDITKSDQAQSSSQYQESTIYEEADKKEPYISRQKLPAVEGILIIAQGGGNSMVKQDILDAALALFPIEAHKIKIVKMQAE